MSAWASIEPDTVLAKDRCSRCAGSRATAWRRGQVVEHGYEGYVAKDEASAYEGGPTKHWLKVKQKNWTVEEDRWRRTISVASSRGPKGK